MVSQKKILVVIPARNEEEFIGKTIESLGAQKPKPAKVIIINDGSTDKTGQIAKKAAEKAKLNFEIIDRKDRGYTALGLATLANVYNDGFKAANLKDYDFMVVNGADALMKSNYFEIMLKYFEAEPKLVIASGLCPGERINIHHVHGSAGRFYRMDFFRIACKGRYEISYAWESVPIFIANVNGLIAKSYQKPIVYHLRPRNTRAKDSIFILRGAAMREVGYWFPYAMGRCLLTAYRRKRLKAGLLMFIGFIRGKPCKQRLELAKQYRKYQIDLARRVLFN